jgi:hypothetical protein
MSRRERREARLAALLSFSAFFAFPALAVGRTTAITIPVVLGGVLTLLWARRLRPPEWSPYAWLLGPAVLSGALVLVAGVALAPDVVPKSVIALAMPLVVVIPARRLLRAGHGEPFVLGAAAAILVHAALGAYQSWAFDRGEFPFVALMRTNPAMSLLTEDVATYVEYVKRPFGLFAEPSAMAACLGPWLVIVTAALFAPAPADAPARSRGRTALLAAALAAGLALVVASKSGLSAVVVAGTAAAALAAALGGRRRTLARGAALVLSGAVAVAALFWIERNAGERFDLGQNDSWQARLDSLRLALRWLGDSADAGARFAIGLGPGQSYPAVHATAVKYQVGGGVEAVWSVGLNYAVETGLLGLCAIVALVAAGARSIWRSPARIAGAACAAVWLTAVFVATSYAGQPALWTALAALLSWREVGGGGG